MPGPRLYIFELGPQPLKLRLSNFEFSNHGKAWSCSEFAKTRAAFPPNFQVVGLSRFGCATWKLAYRAKRMVKRTKLPCLLVCHRRGPVNVCTLFLSRGVASC